MASTRKAELDGVGQCSNLERLDLRLSRIVAEEKSPRIVPRTNESCRVLPGFIKWISWFAAFLLENLNLTKTVSNAGAQWFEGLRSKRTADRLVTGVNNRRARDGCCKTRSDLSWRSTVGYVYPYSSKGLRRPPHVHIHIRSPLRSHTS